VLAEGYEPSEEIADAKSRRHVRKRLRRIRVSRRIEFVADLPKTLTERSAAIELAPGATELERAQTPEALRRIGESPGPGERVLSDRNFTGLPRGSVFLTGGPVRCLQPKGGYDVSRSLQAPNGGIVATWSPNVPVPAAYASPRATPSRTQRAARVPQR